MCNGKFYRALPYLYAAINILEFVFAIVIVYSIAGTGSSTDNTTATTTTIQPPVLVPRIAAFSIAFAGSIVSILTGMTLFLSLFACCICCIREKIRRPFLRCIVLNCNCPCYIPRPYLRFRIRLGFHIICITLRFIAVIIYGTILDNAGTPADKQVTKTLLIIAAAALIFPFLTILLDLYHYRVWWAYQPDVVVPSSYIEKSLSRKHKRFIPYVLIERFRTAGLGNKKCKYGNHCQVRELEHIVIFHSTDFRPQNRWSPAYPTYIGFHRTQADYAISIAHNDMSRSEKPPQMLGFGIYFARSISNTEGKARNVGAFICAEIDMGKVLVLTKSELGRVKNSNAWWTDYDTVYYQHDQEERDEFCVKSSDQVLRWIIYIEPPMDRKLHNYRMDEEYRDTICYCI